MLLVVACGPQKSELDKKKEELKSLKAGLTDMNLKIRSLEEEIARLDTSKASFEKVKSVVVTPLAPSVFRHFVSVQGMLEADENLMVTSKMPGMITTVKVKEGDFVQKGQLLCVLDDDILQKSMEEAKTGLAQVNVLYEKQKALWDQKIGTEFQYLNLKNQKEQIEKKIETLKSQMENAYVTAPFSGVIDEVMAKTGTMANPGFPLFQLVNTNSVKAVAKVPDSYVSYVKNGDMVNLQFPDLNKTIQARVNYVGRIVDPLSRTFRIEVEIPGGSGELKPNLLTLIQINDKTSNAALVIDENLIQPTENGKLVYVAATESGKSVASQRIVTTGLSYNGKVEILSGLQAGEALITTGYQDLSDKQLLRIQN